MPLPPAQVPDPHMPLVVRGWASFVVAAITPRRSLLKHHRIGPKVVQLVFRLAADIQKVEVWGTERLWIGEWHVSRT